jgi:signal transduction histidine kinase
MAAPALSLRARLLTIGVIGVAGALAIGSLTLYAALTVLSYRTLDTAARSTATEVADLVARNQLPDPIPVTGSQLVQVVDARDRVVTSSVQGDRLSAMLQPSDLARARAGDAVEVPGSRMGLDSPLRVVARPIRSPGAAGASSHENRLTVLVAQQLDGVARSRRILGVTLLATYPVLLLALALIAWRVLGAALRPVESLRAAAERISGTETDTRLPVPASHDEIAALAVTLNSMLERLAAARRRQRTFVADAAHELRSPLASLQLQLDVARRLDETTSQSEDLELEVARMVALVDDLLLLARLGGDTTTAAGSGVSSVTSLLEGVQRRFAASRVPVEVTPPAEHLQVRGGAEELGRAVGNLVDNAVRHARTRVTVQVRELDGRVEVAVVDDGSGIPEADRDRVFERFTRLDEGRARDAGGSGLGLAIVADVAAHVGGGVRLVEAEGGGLRAELVLEAVPPQEGA